MMKHEAMLVALCGALVLGACGRSEAADAGAEARQGSGYEAAAPQAAEPGPVVEPELLSQEPAIDGNDAPVAAAPGAVAAELPAPAPAAPAPAAEQQRPANDDANEIMRRVERAYNDVRSMEADFVQHLTVPLLNSTQRSEGRLYQRRPDRFLMRFTDPAGDIMLADGRYFWMYNPSVDQTQVMRTRIAEGGAQADLQQQFLSNPTQRFVATLVRTEAVDGRNTHLLSLVPRGASPYRLVRVWVDQQDHLVRRFEITEENESVRRLELRNLRLNTNIPDSVFQFTPPPGTQVFDH